MKKRLGKDLVNELTSALKLVGEELSNVHLVTGKRPLPKKFTGMFKDPMDLHTFYSVIDPLSADFINSLQQRMDTKPDIRNKLFINAQARHTDKLLAHEYPNGNIVYIYIEKDGDTCIAGFIGNLFEESFDDEVDSEGLPMLSNFIGSVKAFIKHANLNYVDKTLNDINPNFVLGDVDVLVTSIDVEEDTTVQDPIYSHFINMLELMVSRDLETIRKLKDKPADADELRKLSDKFNEASRIIGNMIGPLTE